MFAAEIQDQTWRYIRIFLTVINAIVMVLLIGSFPSLQNSPYCAASDKAIHLQRRMCDQTWRCIKNKSTRDQCHCYGAVDGTLPMLAEKIPND